MLLQSLPANCWSQNFVVISVTMSGHLQSGLVAKQNFGCKKFNCHLQVLKEPHGIFIHLCFSDWLFIWAHSNSPFENLYHCKWTFVLVVS
jgi:hypothetical protein